MFFHKKIIWYENKNTIYNFYIDYKTQIIIPLIYSEVIETLPK